MTYPPGKAQTAFRTKDAENDDSGCSWGGAGGHLLFFGQIL